MSCYGGALKLHAVTALVKDGKIRERATRFAAQDVSPNSHKASIACQVGRREKLTTTVGVGKGRGI